MTTLAPLLFTARQLASCVGIVEAGWWLSESPPQETSRSVEADMAATSVKQELLFIVFSTRPFLPNFHD
jgi:hypothetical protein